MNALPVAVFAYNRPARLRRILDALERSNAKSTAIERLVIFVDGPKGEGDRRHVEACRSLAAAVDWAPAERVIRNDNRGLAGLIENIDWMFARFPAAIFIEDDCLPAAGFIDFAGAALDRYRCEARVFSVGGYQPVALKDLPVDRSAGVFCARFMCWGWASWKDRWDEVRPLLDGYMRLFDDLTQVPEVAGSDLPVIARKMAAGEIGVSWDIQVALACLALKKIHLLPRRGLIRNIGLGSGGVHTDRITGLRGWWLHNRNLAGDLPLDIPWPKAELSCEYTGALMKFVSTSRTLSVRRRLRLGWRAAQERFAPGSSRLAGLDLRCTVPPPMRRALVSCRTLALALPADDPLVAEQIDLWYAREIVAILNHLGYRVDAIDRRATQIDAAGEYALYLGFGGRNFPVISLQLPDHTPKIFIAPAADQRRAPARTAGETENERSLPSSAGLDRTGVFEAADYLPRADAWIVFGGPSTHVRHAGVNRLGVIDGVTRYDGMHDWCADDPFTARQHFLFYTAQTNLEASLPLLLQAFSGLKQHLWILTPLLHEFRRAYRRELAGRANIHILDWTASRTPEYYRALRHCAWCILPAYPGWQSHAILETMNQGLIPIVSPEAGVDIHDFGELIESANPTTIADLVRRLAELPADEIGRRSLAARYAAQTRHSEARFRTALEAALAVLVEAGSANSAANTRPAD